MTPALNNPLWWRYRVANAALSALPLQLQYRLAETWGRWRSPRMASDDAAIRHAIASLVQPQGGYADAAAASRQYQGLQSRIRLDDHRMATASVPAVVSQVTATNANALAPVFNSGTGTIILTAHYGRLGMIGPGLRSLGKTSAFLSATVDERATALSPMQRWVGYRNGQSLQRFAQGQWVMADDPATRLRAVLRQGQPLIVVMDAFSSRSPQRHVFRFGSGSMAIPTGVVRLAEATGAPLVLALMHDMGNAQVQMRCRSLQGSPQQAVQQAFDTLAQAVLAEPWQWWLLPHAHALWQPHAANTAATPCPHTAKEAPN